MDGGICMLNQKEKKLNGAKLASLNVYDDKYKLRMFTGQK